MAKDYIAKKYTIVPVKTIVIIIATIIYIVNPFDIIPDVIPVAGLSDDLLAVTYCLKCVSEDIQKYKEWKISNGEVVSIQ